LIFFLGQKLLCCCAGGFFLYNINLLLLLWRITSVQKLCNHTAHIKWLIYFKST
jgi:hypothetical protein